MVINQRAGSVALKTLLLPVKAGEQLPEVRFDAVSQSATVKWGNQTDVMRFTAGPDGRTLLKVTRGGQQLIRPSIKP